MQIRYIAGISGLIVIVFASLLLLPGCQNDSSTNETTQTTPILYIAAASDLYDAFTEIGQSFEQESGIQITFTFGSTGQITQQIEQGGPYDLFAAAHESYIDRLIERGHMDQQTKRIYAWGRIGFMFDPANLSSPLGYQDLLRTDIQSIAIANPDHAPYGKAAQQAMQTWGIWEDVRDKLIYADNIRHALQLVESGNVDTGMIAYALSMNSDLTYEQISPDVYEPIIQALGIPNQSPHKQAAWQFIEYLFSDSGQEIMTSYGFDIPQ